MKLNYNIIFLILPLLFIQLNQKTFADASLHGLEGFSNTTIDASKNARLHSNMGNIYFDEKNYIGALKEYQVAFNLTHKTQESAVYLYNISQCFKILGNYQLALDAIKGAIDRNCINMVYYDSLVDCYIHLGTEKKELKNHLRETKNPYDRIIAGLIYLKTGQRIEAKILFDEFVLNYPDLIITEDIKIILNKL